MVVPPLAKMVATCFPDRTVARSASSRALRSIDPSGSVGTRRQLVSPIPSHPHTSSWHGCPCVDDSTLIGVWMPSGRAFGTARWIPCLTAWILVLLPPKVKTPPDLSRSRPASCDTIFTTASSVPSSNPLDMSCAPLAFSNDVYAAAATDAYVGGGVTLIIVPGWFHRSMPWK